MPLAESRPGFPTVLTLLPESSARMHVISRPFWNPHEHRLRAGVRVVLHFLLFVGVTAGRDVVSAASGASPAGVVAATVAYVAGGLALAWVMAHRVDRRSLADYGLHLNGGWWLDLVVGLILGAVLMTGVFLSLRWAGWVTVTGPAATSTGMSIPLAAALRVLFYTAVAFNEELAFRGYELKNLAEGLAGGRVGAAGAMLLAVLCSSLLFGAAHASNANATVVSTLAIVLNGLLIAWPFLLTGELAMSVGLHLTWNLFQGLVFGFPVSGNIPATHLLSIEVAGPSAWTGGAFGPEAGLVAFGWALVGGGVVAWWVRVRGRRVALHLPVATWTPPPSPGPGPSSA